MHRTHVANVKFVATLLLSALSFCGQSLAQAPANLFQQIPTSFEVNKGQFTDDVRYVAHTSGYKASIKSNELVLHTEPSQSLATKIKEKRATATELQTAQPVKLSFVGANANAQAAAEDVSTRRTHYMWGEGGNLKSIIDVPHYRRVRVANLYQGVDVVYYGAQADMEYDLVVQPGADTSRIKLKFDRDAVLDAEGNLVIGSGDGKIIHRKPVVYQQGQQKAATKTPVASRYAKNADGTFGIALGDYDRKAPLTIDPVISFVTLMGGGRDDELRDATMDSLGRVILAGYTSSSNFPAINAPVASYPTGAGGEAAFVTRLNASGTDIEFSTVLFNAKPNALQLDNAGNIYVAADAVTVNNAISSVPITAGAYQPAGNAAYLFKLSADGRTLLASTFLGNGGSVRRIAVNAAGELAILGSSVITTTPGVWAAIKPTNNSDFVARLNPLLQTASFATYIPAVANSVAIDAMGNVYVAGQTSDAAFPVTAGAIQSLLCGATDGFVTKLSSTGQVLASTFIGGNANAIGPNLCSGNDTVNDVVVGSSGAIFISGGTDSSIGSPPAAHPFLSTPQFDDWNSLQLGGNTTTGRRYILGNLQTKGLLGTPTTFLAKLSNDLKTIVYSGGILTATNVPYLEGVDGGSKKRLQLDSSENVLLSARGGAGLHAPGSLGSAGQYIMAINAAGVRQYASFVPDGRALRDPVSGDVYVLSSPTSAALAAVQPTAGNPAGLGGIEISIMKIRNPLAKVAIAADKTTLTSGGILQLSALASNLPSGGTFVFRSSNQEIGRVPATTAIATLTLANMAPGIQFYSVRYEHPSMPNPVASSSIVVTINQPEVCN
jgi:hypothetical protein